MEPSKSTIDIVAFIVPSSEERGAAAGASKGVGESDSCSEQNSGKETFGSEYGRVAHILLHLREERRAEKMCLDWVSSFLYFFLFLLTCH